LNSAKKVMSLFMAVTLIISPITAYAAEAENVSEDICSVNNAVSETEIEDVDIIEDEFYDINPETLIEDVDWETVVNIDNVSMQQIEDEADYEDLQLSAMSENASGIIYASTLGHYADLVLNGDTTLIMDTEIYLQSIISSDYELTVQGDYTLHVQSASGNAIVVKSLRSTAPIEILASAYGIFAIENISISNTLIVNSGESCLSSSNGHITVNGATELTSSGSNAISAQNGCVAIHSNTNRLKIESKQAGGSCIFAQGQVTLIGAEVQVISASATSLLCFDDITLGGNVTVNAGLQDAGSVYFTMNVGASGKITIQDGSSVTITGKYGLQGMKGIFMDNGSLYVESKDGNAAVFSEEGRVSLNGNVTLLSISEDGHSSAICAFGNEGVSLTGTMIQITSTSPTALISMGDMTLGGNITINAGSNFSHGVQITNNVAARNIEIQQGSNVVISGRFGLAANENITMNGESLTVNCTEGKAIEAVQSINLGGTLKITTPENGKVSGGTILDSNNEAAKSVVIERKLLSGIARILGDETYAGEQIEVLTSGFPSGYRIQWQRSTDNATWSDIAEAFRDSYQTKLEDGNRYFRVKVTADNYSGEVYSESRQVKALYNISFDANGGSGNIPLAIAKAGVPFDLPSTCEFTPPENKMFSGKWLIVGDWTPEGGVTIPAGYQANIRGNTTIKPIWVDAYVTITFDANGGNGSMAPQQVDRFDDWTLPSCGFTAPEGKVFSGIWKVEFETAPYKYYSVGEKVKQANENMTVRPIWNTQQLYKVITHDCTTDKEYYAAGETVTVTPVTNKPTSEFYVWERVTDNFQIGENDWEKVPLTFTMPAGNVEIKATFMAISVTGVTLDKENAELTVGDTLQLTATVQPDNAANKSVTWSVDDPSVATVNSTGLVTALKAGTTTVTVKTAGGVSISANCTITVNEAATHTVSFNMNGHGDQIAAQTVRKGDKATKPTEPTASGWTFGGWYADATFSTAFDFNTAINADTTIYAKWTQNITPPATTYTVSFNMNGHGSQLGDLAVETGSTVTKPADPAAIGYMFGGWYKDTAFTTAWNFDTDTITENTTLYALWVQNTTVYTIIAGANGEWTKGSTTGLAFTSDAPFDKFYSVKVDGSTIAATNYTAEAGSTKITLVPAYLETLSVGVHTIEIVSNDGSASTNFTVKSAEQPPVVPANYTVSFNMNGHGDQITAQTVKEGEKATKPTDPTASGWTFNGWYADATFSAAFDFDTAINADTTIYAKWTKETSDPGTTDPQPATYTVTFNMNGHGTQVPAQTVEEGNKAAKPADPSASGYTFDGWYADATFSAKFDFSSAINANTTVYAKWTEVKKDEPTKPADPTNPANPTQPTKPADPTSPQTGDNSHLFLWVALLFISGGALAGTAVYGKKRKYNAK